MADPRVSPDRARFGPFELDFRTRELRKGPARLKIPDQSIAVLAALVERPGDLVTREELKDRLWPADTFVDFERGLNGVVRRLREALGDSAETPRYIETLPRRGYRFVGLVEAGPPASEVVTTAPVAPPTRRKWLGVVVVAAVLLLVAAIWAVRGWNDRSGLRPAHVAIAVLPFEVAADADDAGYLGIGLPDTIISRLAVVAGIRVRPIGAVVKWQPSAGNAAEAGRALSVAYVLTGEVRRDGERIVITPRLLRVADGVSLWTQAYTRSPRDLLGLHNQIAGAVVDALQLQISSEERDRVDRPYTTDVEAYALYVRGRSQLARNNPEGAAAAFGLFQSALARDPRFALAYAGVAAASAQTRLFFAEERDVTTWEARAQEAARRALELDPGLAEVHEALASIYRSAEFDWHQAIEESNQALALNRNLDMPHLYRASAFAHLGLLDRVPTETAAATAVNPDNTAEPLRVQGMTAMFDGRFQEAVVLLEKAASAGGRVVAEWNLAYSYYYVGRKAEAEAMLRNIRGSARRERRAQATLASLLAARGQRAEALTLIAILTGAQHRDHHVAYSLGVAHAQLGQASEAIRWLMEARSTGFPCFPWFERDPLLAPIRSTPAFRQLIGDMERTWELAAARHRGH